jgi:hypothetical protein
VQQQSSLLTVRATELYDKIAHVEQLAAKLAAAHEQLTEALNARAIATATLHEALDGAAQRKAEAEAKMAKMDEERAAQAVVHLRSGLKPQVTYRGRASMHARLEQLHRHVRLRVLDLKGTKGGCEARVAIAAGRGPGDFIKMKSPITEASCALVELGSAVAALDALSC